MKKMIPFLGLALISANAFASPTPVTYKTDGQAIELYGVIPSAAKILASGYFVPTAETVKNCNFADEELSPNGQDHSSTFEAVYKNGSYVVDLPFAQSRDKCQYTLRDISITIQGKAVYQPIDIVSPAYAAQLDPTNEDGTPQSFSSLKTLYCNFEDDLGLCNDVDEQLPNGFFLIDLKSQKIQFDIKDVSQDPKHVNY